MEVVDEFLIAPEVFGDFCEFWTAVILQFSQDSSQGQDAVEALHRRGTRRGSRPLAIDRKYLRHKEDVARVKEGAIAKLEIFTDIAARREP